MPKGREDTGSETMLKRLKKAIWISKPAFWIFFPVAYFIGLVASQGQIGVLEIAQMLLLSIPFSFYSFGLNDIYDIETDKLNSRKRNKFWGEVLDENDTRYVKRISILIVLTIFASTVISGSIAQVITTTLLLLPAPFLYSAPPVRLKSVPVLDALYYGMHLFAPFAMGFSLYGGFGYLHPFFILFALTFSAGQAIGTVADVNEDKKTGITTFATAFGPRAPALFAALIFLVNIPGAYHLMRSAGVVIAIFALLSALIALKPTPNNAARMGAAMMVIFMLEFLFVVIAVPLGFETINYEWLYSLS